MEEEIKKAYMDWSEKGVSYLNCMYVYDTMMDVDEALQTCDTILDEIDLGIDYTSRKKDIDRLLEGHGTLHRYIDVLNCYVDDKLDQPLYPIRQTNKPDCRIIGYGGSEEANNHVSGKNC